MTVPRDALAELLDALPPYVGLAVYLDGEENEFTAAEDRLAKAYRVVKAYHEQAEQAEEAA